MGGINKISLIVQEGTLKSYFPDSFIKRNGENEIYWTHQVTPSPLSNTYRLLLHYSITDGADVYVLEPRPLKLAPGKDLLPHVYSTPGQKLCLYYPKYREWTPAKLYVKTLIPWACEWLVHYELWSVTGIWYGGGIDHENEAEENDINNAA